MSQRRYPTAELYEERQSDFYRPGRRPAGREYEELDVDIRRGRDLDFLNEDYGRTAGQMVVRHQPREARSTRARSVERDEVIIRRDDQPRRRAEKEEIDVTIRRDEGSVRSAPRRIPPRERTRDVERDDDIVVDHRDIRRGGRVVGHEDDVIITHNHNDRGRDHHHDDRETIEVRHRSRSRPRYDSTPLPRPRPISQHRDEIIIDTGRRRARSRSSSFSRSPPRRRGNIDTEEIIIRRTEQREPSPIPPPRVRTPSPEPEPLPPPIMRPPIHQQIHQEIITHHRHIDHGVERAWSPEPSPPPAPRTPTPEPPTPPPPARKTEETIEVDIRRRRRGGFDEEITIEHDHRGRHDHETSLALRPRSLSAPRRRGGYNDELEGEANYYNRKAMQRAYVGEAEDGFTRDWNIVDVPPGTERVRMDGAGGSSQEITWQRYNGVRRSKFLAGGREFDTGFGTGHDRLSERDQPPMALPPSRPPPSKMWTEITKDLVLKDAIDAFGYDYEETEFFFYVMEYMRYEDVLQLVELSEDMRQDRRRRIREIEWEREQLRRDRERLPRRGGDRYYEHEVIVDTRRRR